jgi:hypothetical protein
LQLNCIEEEILSLKRTCPRGVKGQHSETHYDVKLKKTPN